MSNTNNVGDSLRCVLCGREEPGVELVPAEMVRAGVRALIQKELDKPMTDREMVCRDDLNRLRARYVESLLERDRGELSRLERDVVKSLARRLMKVSIEGGEPFALCECYGAPTWSDDGNVYFGPGASTLLDPIGSIWRVSSAGGDPQLLYEPEPPAALYRRPFALPGGEWLLIQIDGTDGSSGIAAASVDGSTIRPLISDGTNPRYAPTGHIVYVRGNALFAVAFDAEGLEIIGEPSPVVQGVLVGTNGIASRSRAEPTTGVAGFGSWASRTTRSSRSTTTV